MEIIVSFFQRGQKSIHGLQYYMMLNLGLHFDAETKEGITTESIL